MCLNCDENSTILPVGSDGEQGPQGIFGGFCAKWNFSSSTASGPSTGDLRFNDSTYTAVSSILVNDTNSEAINYEAFLDSFDNNGYFGYVRVFKENDSSVFWLGEVLAVTDNGTDHAIDVSYILHNGTFAEDDSIVICFSPSGAAPIIIPQRLNTIFRQQDTPYISTSSNAFVEAGTMVYMKSEFGDVKRCRIVVEGNTKGSTGTLKVTDIDGTVLWNQSFTINNSATKEVKDLSTPLTSSSTNNNYLKIEYKSDGTNTLKLYSIDFYNT